MINLTTSAFFLMFVLPAEEIGHTLKSFKSQKLLLLHVLCPATTADKSQLPATQAGVLICRLLSGSQL